MPCGWGAPSRRFVPHRILRATGFDIGANEGSYTVLAAKVAGASVVAVEPVPDTFDARLANPALRGLIMELNGSGERYGHSDAAVFSAIVAAGFAPYRYEPFSRRLDPLEGPNRDGGNTLFLRDLPFVQRRVKSARTVDVREVAVWVGR